MLSLPTVSLLGCFLILCHYIKLLEPVKNLENFKENFISTNRGTASSPNSATKLPSNITSKPFKGRRSPVPKPLSEVEIQNQNYGWIDWAWWTAFNFSLGKQNNFLSSVLGHVLIPLDKTKLLIYPFLTFSWMPRHCDSKYPGISSSTSSSPMATFNISILCCALYVFRSLLPHSSVTILY